MEAIFAAFTLSTGYNAAPVAVGAGLLGVAAGTGGSFLVLDRRALVAYAMAHATLPGIALGFLAMAALGGEGRALPGLLAGAAATARLIRNRLAGQVWWSVRLAALSAVLGCVLAGYGPLRLGAAHALGAAGMIATVSGLMLAPRLPDRPAPASGGAGPAACG